MRAVVLVLCLMLVTVWATERQLGGAVPVKVAARWGIPSFEDEACVLCQYAVQRVENKIVLHLDELSKANGAVPSTMNPFSSGEPVSPALLGTATSAADQMGFPVATGPNGPASGMSDLSFEPSVEYKKSLIASLKSRWGGASILRKIWEEFLTDFCAQSKLPELYVPVCSMMYEQARKIMKLLYHGFPTDQVCLISRMCGRNSYFTAPTAVHDPVMSLYWNNRRGLDGFEGGVQGVTRAQLLDVHHYAKAQAKKAKAARKALKEKRRKALANRNKKRGVKKAKAAKKTKKSKKSKKGKKAKKSLGHRLKNHLRRRLKKHLRNRRAKKNRRSKKHRRHSKKKNNKKK